MEQTITNDTYQEHTQHSTYEQSCSTCFTEDKLKNELIDNNERKLQDYFIALREYDGRPITKENVEDMFDGWLENQSLSFLEKIIYDLPSK